MPEYALSEKKKYIDLLTSFPWSIPNPLLLWLTITHGDNGTLTPLTYPRVFNPTTLGFLVLFLRDSDSHFLGRFSIFLPSVISTTLPEDIYEITLPEATASVQST